MGFAQSTFFRVINARFVRLAACLAAGWLICMAPAKAQDNAVSPRDNQAVMQATLLLDRFLDDPEVRLQTQRWGLSESEFREHLDRLSAGEKTAIVRGLKRFSAPSHAERAAAADTMYLLTALLLKDALLISRIVSVHAGSFQADR